MTSAVHGGIHNMSRHVAGVGRVDIMSSICGLAVLRNQVLSTNLLSQPLLAVPVYPSNLSESPVTDPRGNVMSEANSVAGPHQKGPPHIPMSFVTGQTLERLEFNASTASRVGEIPVDSL